MPLPPTPLSGPDAYAAVLKRLQDRLHTDGLDQQILAVLKRAFEQEFSQEHVLLARPDRVRLYRDVGRAVLTSALAKLDDTQ